MKKLPKLDFSSLETETLKFWRDNNIFQKSLDNRKGKELYTFYDGPPFANGQPHFGHSLVTSIKDAVGRYKTMQGYYVPRVNGWDTHGLPVEYEIEKKYKISGKKQILDMGLDKFNQACRDSVFLYKKEWEDFFERIGRWTDKDNAYATMDNSYIESVWWVFAQIHQKGLLYKGFKCMPFCPRCDTPLSNFEVNEGYRDNVSDPSVFVKFEIVDRPDEHFLVWTTTPWTLPGNVALAINRNFEYVLVELTDENGKQKLILAKDRLEVLDSETYKVIKSYNGKELIGLQYKPLFPYYGFSAEDLSRVYQVYEADFVNLDEGSGIVHIAPAFGEDDLILSQKNDLPVAVSVNSNGKIYKSGLDEIDGKFFKDADPIIIKNLTKRNLIYSAEELKHTYPFCYRCKTPLMYYSISTWFINVSKIKNQLTKSAQPINWIPAHIKKGRFGKWLENARDWAISRNRYWGAPLPIWVNEADQKDYIVVQSALELEKLSGKKNINNLHRPKIDQIIIKKDGKTYKRVEEVLDCWFESGSMPYAQIHYPFENKDTFSKTFPADYIGEGLDQTRLWFYVLHIISTILFDKPAYKNVLVNGIIMAADGRKLSKSLKNYPPLDEVFNTVGADSLRMYLLSSPPAVNADYMRFDARGGLKDINRNLFMTLYNSASFYSMYANLDKFKPKDLNLPKNLKNPLDLWMVQKVYQTVLEATKAADKYDLSKATRPIIELVDEMSNWYIRRSRRRFWKSDNDVDKRQAYETLFWTLIKTCQLLAPWAPFMSDYLYRNLTSDMDKQKKSVHLTNWPKQTEINQSILDDMSLAREMIVEGLAQRANNKIKVRQPLSNVSIISKSLLDPELIEIIKDELNVKKVLVKKGKELSVNLNTKVTRDLKLEGIARDMIRFIQSSRREAGLNVEDRISLIVDSKNKDIVETVKKYQEMIASEVLAKELLISDKKYQFKKQISIDDMELSLSLKKISD